MKNKTVKRILAMLVASAFVGGVTVAALPLAAYGDEEFRTDNGTIEIGETYDNYANNVTNNGTVDENYGVISNNNGTVEYNNPGATIVTNNDSDGINVSVNYGRIENNYGLVFQSEGIGEEEAIIVNNYNQIAANFGEVTHNYGSLRNEGGGFVAINHEGGHVSGGTINMNLGEGTLQNGVNVLKQMWKITSDVWAGLTATEGTAGDTYTELDEDGEFEDFWLWENGSVMLSASDATRAIQNVTLTGDAVITDNGDGTWTISDIGANIEIVVVFDDEGNPVPIEVRTVPETDEDTSSNNLTVSAPATGNVITAAQVSAMIESALAAAPDATVLDADFGNDPSLTADTLVTLCEKNNVAKRCHFTHKGMKFVLFIPAVDPTSAAYQQCKALLDLEPGKQAGPIRMFQLFAPVGFSLSGE